MAIRLVGSLGLPLETAEQRMRVILALQLVVNAASASVSSYRIAADGALTLVDAVAASTGAGPTDAAVSPDGRSLHVRMRDGSVSSFTIGSNGSLAAAGSAFVTAAFGVAPGTASSTTLTRRVSRGGGGGTALDARVAERELRAESVVRGGGSGSNSSSSPNDAEGGPPRRRALTRRRSAPPRGRCSS